MRCNHCKHEFDTVALKAKQGEQVTCPACGKMTTVSYSFTDSLKDFRGFLARDPKYVSTPRVLGYIGIVIVALAVIGLFIRYH